jgi:thioredoxin-related protein
MITRLFFLLLFPVYLSASTPAKIDFYKGSLNNAKEIAMQEGKLYFVQFTASWCEPCRWMDEVTYKDHSVVEYIKENYIPVKVDIDDFDGFAYKQKYNIRMLPSVLVFSSTGELLKKYEEALPPTTMLKILKLHNISANRTAPRSYGQIDSKLNPQQNTVHSPIKEPISRPALKPSKSLLLTAGQKSDLDLSNTNKKIAEGEELFHFKVTSQASNGFSVQIGVYSEYGNVLQKAAKVQDKFDEQMIVHIARVNNKTVYKIMIGEFTTRKMANDFRGQVEAKGFNAIVKDLSLMK